MDRVTSRVGGPRREEESYVTIISTCVEFFVHFLHMVGVSYGYRLDSRLEPVRSSVTFHSLGVFLGSLLTPITPHIKSKSPPRHQPCPSPSPRRRQSRLED